MNIIDFLDDVNFTMLDFSKRDLFKIIYEEARILPEEQREDFLKVLYRALPGIKDSQKLRDKLIEVYHEYLETIKYYEGETSVLREKVSKFYPSHFLMDPYFETFVSKAKDFIAQLAEFGLYEECLDLGRKLLNTPFGIEMSSSEIVRDTIPAFKMLGVRMILEDLMTTLVYAAYKYYPEERRVDAFMEFFDTIEPNHFNLESILQQREEITDFSVFLNALIPIFYGRTDYFEEDLVMDAFLLLLKTQEDNKFFQELVKEYADEYPDVFLYLFTEDELLDSEKCKFGPLVLENIPSRPEMQSEIALEVIKAAERKGYKTLAKNMVKYVLLEESFEF